MLTHVRHDDVVVDARTGPPVANATARGRREPERVRSRVVPASRSRCRGMRSVPRRSLRSCRNWLRSSDSCRLVTQARRRGSACVRRPTGCTFTTGRYSGQSSCSSGTPTDRAVARGRRPSTFIAARVAEGAAREHDERLGFGAEVAVPTTVAIQGTFERGREHWNVLVRNLEVEERPRSGLPGVDVSDVGA